MIANAHMKNFHADRRTEIRALADVNTQALQAMGSEYGIPHLTTDYRDILKDPGLDAVVVCTPPGLHARIGIDVLRAKKPRNGEAACAHAGTSATTAQKKPKSILNSW